MAEYISREAAMLQIDAADFVRDDNFEGGATLLYCDDVVDRLSAIPAADVRPVVKAKWEDVHIDRPEIADLEVASMFCPNCNRWHNEVYNYGNPTEMANFCPYCGADMRTEEGE